MSDTLTISGSPFLRRLVRNISLPQRVLGFLLMLLLIYFVLMPAINLVYTAFRYSIADRRLPQVVDAGREIVPGQFTLVHFQRLGGKKLSSSP